MDPQSEAIYKLLQYENIPSRPCRLWKNVLIFQYCLICGCQKYTDEEWKNSLTAIRPFETHGPEPKRFFIR